ncbi:hypothetical protein OBBRIDRAFT_765071 [Obba rivulosa]|uniref:Zn(2)-C6 fungal-type domain-containing protein n=1 Tax=Obba rivulosa TaxID=1052685 RepID=A0A8E2AFN2_9APHY|nr:hypothetical protein OBBRIDRAFT_765071 [Obba rivulosa]
MYVVNASSRQDVAAKRKRRKYTRSQTGCLTCRAKKIKCDETKPNCVRCTHGQRECIWPEGVSPRKKPVTKRETVLETSGFNTRPSTAGSSGLSEAPTPPIRNHAPPKREPIELGLPPMVSRRHPDPSMHMPIMTNKSGLAYHQQTPALIAPAPGYGYPMHSNSHTHGLPALPEVVSSYSNYAIDHRHAFCSHLYGYGQLLSAQPVHFNPSSPSSQWSSPPMLTPGDSTPQPWF